MITLDKQRKLQIPISLIRHLDLKGIVYLYQTNSTILFTSDFNPKEYGDFIAEIKLDNKNRFIVPKIVEAIIEKKGWFEDGILCINSEGYLCIKGLS